MKRKIQDLCPANIQLPTSDSRPSRNPIFPAVVYQCDSIEQADQRLSGKEGGYVYLRDGHPNADILAEKCRQLHAAEKAVVTSTGMSAIALAVVSQLQSGDHILLSNRLYGRTTRLIQEEASRLGIESSVANFSEVLGIESAVQKNTRMLIVETISNPLLRVVDLHAAAELAHANNAILLVDNTFASPMICQPLGLGADLVVESLTKIMNGHSDVMLGLLCGHRRHWQRVESAIASWGFNSSPMDCWLAERGLSTLYARLSLASATAMWIAEQLESMPEISQVIYPGLASHTDHATAAAQFGRSQGSKTANEIKYSHLISMQLNGGAEAADRFIRRSTEIAFCPSLGELSTTISHPASTSHRGLTTQQRERLGIYPGTIRLSVGLESREMIMSAIQDALEKAS